MFTLESSARAILATIIPLQAYDILKSARDISIIYIAVGIIGLIASFAIPLLIRWLSRRWVYALGAVVLFSVPALLATYTLTGQIAAMLLRTFASSCINTTLSLYIMDYIHRHDLVRSEPLRFQVSSASWCIGPSLGVYVYSSWSPEAAFALSASFSVLALINFWRFGLKSGSEAEKSDPKPINPWVSIRRFVEQPRLRLAWTLAFGRSFWWAMFMTYGPLFMVESGTGPLAGAVLVSVGNALLFLAPAWGRLAQRIRIRMAVVVAFAVAGTATLLATVLSPWPYLAGFLLLIAAFAAVGLDGLAGIPFLRAVRSFERPQMVVVYRTYIQGADFISSAVFAVLLSFYDIPAVFAFTAFAMFATGAFARYLPRRL
jgi:predicted MFS family arabinose efflux permease